MINEGISEENYNERKLRLVFFFNFLYEFQTKCYHQNQFATNNMAQLKHENYLQIKCFSNIIDELFQKPIRKENTNQTNDNTFDCKSINLNGKLLVRVHKLVAGGFICVHFTVD